MYKGTGSGEAFFLGSSGSAEACTGALSRKRVRTLNLEAEAYYGLDETGTRIWQVVTTALNIDDAYRALLTEFDVEAELLRQNLSDLLGQLVDNGLLRIHYCRCDRLWQFVAVKGPRGNSSATHGANEHG